MRSPSPAKVARKYVVKGRVQGVGFRAFVNHIADRLGVRGWAGNRHDGSVEVYAVGTPEQLAEFSNYLWKGPSMSDVTQVDEAEAALQDASDFQIRF